LDLGWGRHCISGIFVTKNSNKSQNTTFWQEKSVENMVAFEGLPFNLSMRNWDVLLVVLEKS
jgi:hypothetical protein